VRSKKQQNVSDKTRFLEKTQEVALSVRPIDIETSFKHVPAYRISFSSVSQPMGPTGTIEDFRIADNPKIPRKVDALACDEVRAKDAAYELYRNRYDVYYIMSVLSSGALGRVEKRTMVPTRWSITCGRRHAWKGDDKGSARASRR